MTTGALLVVGGTSGAGKSTLVAGLCRSLARRGVSVAPYKAQNMSNHAAVTPDGGEIGRAQAMQASAAGVEIDRRMNPVLLKPRAGHRSHVVVMGDEITETTAAGYGDVAVSLKSVVLEAIDSLRGDVDWVVAEGAGGAAEINLLERDLVNLPLAAAAGIPAVLVVDIERGGAFAMAHGTIDLVPERLRQRIAGIVINKFHGDASLLESGIADLECRSGIPVLGVLPFLADPPILGVEDSLDIATPERRAVRSTKPVRVAAIHFPHLSNPSDLDPFVIEPDVALSWVTSPDALASADLIVLGGSRATVDDLDWLRRTGLADALCSVVEQNSATVVGLCGGYQMLGDTIDDEIESRAGRVIGLGLLGVATRFAEPKIVRRRVGVAGRHQVHGFEIRFGRPVSAAPPWLMLDDEPEGAVRSDRCVFGSSLHGVFDADDFRTRFLAEVAAQHGRTYAPAEWTLADQVEAQHERLADWVDAHLDVERLLEIGSGASAPGQGPGWEA